MSSATRSGEEETLKFPDQSPQGPAAAGRQQQGHPPKTLYRGHGFSLQMDDGWQDKTIYTLIGPVTDGVQHNIMVQPDNEAEGMSLADYADWQIRTLEEQIRGCRVLLRQQVTLASGLPAYRAIFSWYPSEHQRIIQEQIYIVAGTKAYRLTATFTKKTRKTIGPAIERMMLSFAPQAETPPNQQKK